MDASQPLLAINPPAIAALQSTSSVIRSRPRGGHFWKDHARERNVASWLEVPRAVAAAAFCVAGVLETYDYALTNDNQRLPNWLFVIDIVLVCYLTLEFLLLRIVAVSDRLRRLLNWEALIEVLLCIGPAWVSVFLESRSLWIQPGGAYRLIYSARFLILFARWRELLNRRLWWMPLSLLQRQIAKTYLVILTTLLFTTSVLQASTWIPAVQSFHDTLFYVVLTLATIGYPDTDNPWGRLLLIGFIFALTLIVPENLSKLVNLLSQTSRFSGRMDKRKGTSHVVIVSGPFNNGIAVVVRMVKELLHPDHGNLRPETIVLLAPCEPPAELQTMLFEPEFRQRVVFLNGSALIPEDTTRAQVHSALACFVLTEKTLGRTLESARHLDAIVVTKALHLNKAAIGYEIPTFIEILDPMSREHAAKAGSKHVVCVGQFAAALLANSVVAPGFATLITNLCRTTAFSNPRLDLQSAEVTWRDLYEMGASSEVYEASLPVSFAGVSFNRAASAIFRATNATLIAVIDDQGKIIVTPGTSYLLHGGETCVVIAQDDSVCEAVRWVTDDDFSLPLISSGLDAGNAAGYGKRRFYHHDTSREAKREQSHNVPHQYELSEVIVKDASDLRDHLLVLRYRSEIQTLVRVLRSRAGEQGRQTVVIMDEEDALPSPTDWSRSLLPQYADVFIIQGSPVSVEDLQRAGASTASHIVVLDSAQFWQSAAMSTQEQTSLRDSDSVMSLLALRICLKEDTQKARVLVCLREITNASLLDLNPVSGESEEAAYSSESFATGACFSTDFVDILLAQQFFSPVGMQVLQNIVSERDCPSRIELVDLPPECSQLPYREIFAYFAIVLGVIPVGIFRQMPEADVVNIRGSRYVFTNPQGDTTIEQNDQVFIMTSHE